MFTVGNTEFCAIDHTFLLSNGTKGTILTYTVTSTVTEESTNVTFEGHYVPPSSICGERNGRCGMSSMFNLDRTILVVVLPFGDGVGLVSYQSSSSYSMIVREKLFLPYDPQSCVPAFFTPFIYSLVPFYGYCFDLVNHAIENMVVNVVFDRLNGSSLQSTSSLSFKFESSSLLSDFIHFPERNENICFSTVNDGCTTFLQNSDVVYHRTRISEWFEPGSIGVPACSSSEPRLQRLGSECMLAAYCNRTTVLINASVMFNIVTHFSNESDGNIFLCSSMYYVRFMNNFLSVHNVSSGEQISGSVSVDAEKILLGDCLVSGDQVYFLTALNDARIILISFTDHSSVLLGENMNRMLVPYIVIDKLVFVNSGTQSLVYNWTRMCTEDHAAIPINFDLVHSFIDQNIAKECECVETTTEPTIFTTSAINTASSVTTDHERMTNSPVDTTTSIGSEPPSNFPISHVIGICAGGLILTATVVAAVIIFYIVLIYRRSVSQ